MKKVIFSFLSLVLLVGLGGCFEEEAPPMEENEEFQTAIDQAVEDAFVEGGVNDDVYEGIFDDLHDEFGNIYEEDAIDEYFLGVLEEEEERLLGEMEAIEAEIDELNFTYEEYADEIEATFDEEKVDSIYEELMPHMESIQTYEMEIQQETNTYKMLEYLEEMEKEFAEMVDILAEHLDE